MDVRELLDPEIAAVLEAVPAFDINAESLANFRGPGPRPPLSDRVVRTEHEVPGDPPVPVRVHRAVDAPADAALPCVVSIHGGGMVMGSYDMDDMTFDAWCPSIGVVGVSVEYRLAPETQYPGALDDCYRALVWVHQNAASLGVDPSRIGVHGVSAGGGLAAAVALHARDRAEVPVAFQLLDCPMLDDRQATPSINAPGLLMWTRDSNVFGWQSYLGDRFGTDDVPYTAAPARATDLSGLPPAFVSVGSIDGFRDEDVDYAQRLNQAGVPCELHVYAGAPHAYQMAIDSAVVRQSKRDKEEWLARQVARPATP